MYFQELKLKYYQLMIELDEHEGSYLAICKHYKAVYETPEVRENADKMKEVMCILFINLPKSLFLLVWLLKTNPYCVAISEKPLVNHICQI